MGVLAYEMATATLPYDGASMPELLGNMLRGRPAAPRTLQPTMPASASAALLRALTPVAERSLRDGAGIRAGAARRAANGR